MKLTGITTIVWDVDNTLYPFNKSLNAEVMAAEITVICNHTKWARNKAGEEMKKIKGKKFVSSTAAAAFLSHIPVAQAAVEMETHFRRSKYCPFDGKLVNMFETLSLYTHYILSNGGSEGIIEDLKNMGLSKDSFAGVITSEITGANKPDPSGFIYIMNKTNKAAETHLMVGDRELVDIQPAKKLGWKTCFVWGTCATADVSIPTVYDVPNVLG